MREDFTFKQISEIYINLNNYIISKFRIHGIDDLVLSHALVLIQLFPDKVLSMSEISDKIKRSPQTVTSLTRKLANLGYIEFSKSKTDNRINLVNLTQKGKSLETIIRAISKNIYEMEFFGMSEAETNEFKSLLTRMNENISSLTKLIWNCSGK